ncbi:GntR family transcriptional regulator [Corynebacteriaceae bacterium 6-324]
MIAESIRNQIATGELKPGDRLPAERELVETFGVARMTVRHSLDILQLEGLIERRRGRSGGTFVLAESPLLESVRIEGLTRRVVSGESGVSTKVLSLTQSPAPLPVAESTGDCARRGSVGTAQVKAARNNTGDVEYALLASGDLPHLG